MKKDQKMSKYVILNSNGLLVRKIHPNETCKVSSFTSRTELAQKFTTKESALANCCGNEKPIKI